MSRGFAPLALVAAATMAFVQPARAATAEGAVMVEAAVVETLAPNKFVWADAETAEAPARIVVNIAEQRAYVYRGDALIAATTISTGKAGNETPSGVFTILQKNIDHRSNKYNNAPMPFMQRLTWDGVAIHAGKNPGFPASHGCIRVPLAFAKKLYGITSLGTTVTVIGADGEIDATPQPAAPDAEAGATAAANRAALKLASR